VKRLPRIGALLAALLLLVVALHGLSRARGFQLFGEIIDRVETDEKLVALTFDDGPREPYTRQILDVLQRHGVKATFFVIGENAERHPGLVRLALSRGHQLGNHSYSHRRMVLCSAEFVCEEIERTDTLLRGLGVQGEIPFRAPYGKKLVVLPWVLSRMDRLHVLFDVVPDPPDYERPEPAVLRDYVVEHVRPGSIVVLHDGGGPRDETVAAVDLIVPALQAMGYRLVTVADLFERSRAPRPRPARAG